MESASNPEIGILLYLAVFSLFFAISVGIAVGYIFGWEPPNRLTPFLHHPFTAPEWLVGLSALITIPFFGVILAAFWFDAFGDIFRSENERSLAIVIYFAAFVIVWLVVLVRTVFLIAKGVYDNPGGFLRSIFAILAIASAFFAADYFFELPILDFIQRSEGADIV